MYVPWVYKYIPEGWTTPLGTLRQTDAWLLITCARPGQENLQVSGSDLIGLIDPTHDWIYDMIVEKLTLGCHCWVYQIRSWRNSTFPYARSCPCLTLGPPNNSGTPGGTRAGLPCAQGWGVPKGARGTRWFDGFFCLKSLDLVVRYDWGETPGLMADFTRMTRNPTFTIPSHGRV